MIYMLVILNIWNMMLCVISYEFVMWYELGIYIMWIVGLWIEYVVMIKMWCACVMKWQRIWKCEIKPCNELWLILWKVMNYKLWCEVYDWDDWNEHIWMWNFEYVYESVCE